jgi:Fe2+ or Zn2+ uptake regulation protein
MAAVRNTRQRAAIRKVFVAPLSPEDVLGAAQCLKERLEIATVYRNLKTLTEEGWLVTVVLPGQAPCDERAGRATITISTATVADGCLNSKAAWKASVS